MLRDRKGTEKSGGEIFLVVACSRLKVTRCGAVRCGAARHASVVKEP